MNCTCSATSPPCSNSTCVAPKARTFAHWRMMWGQRLARGLFSPPYGVPPAAPSPPNRRTYSPRLKRPPAKDGLPTCCCHLAPGWKHSPPFAFQQKKPADLYVGNSFLHKPRWKVPCGHCSAPIWPPLSATIRNAKPGGQSKSFWNLETDQSEAS